MRKLFMVPVLGCALVLGLTSDAQAFGCKGKAARRGGNQGVFFGGNQGYYPQATYGASACCGSPSSGVTYSGDGSFFTTSTYTDPVTGAVWTRHHHHHHGIVETVGWSPVQQGTPGTGIFGEPAPQQQQGADLVEVTDKSGKKFLVPSGALQPKGTDTPEKMPKK